MNIFNLTAQLTLDKNEYTKGIDKAKQEGKSFSEATEKAIGIIAKASWLEFLTTPLSILLCIII